MPGGLRSESGDVHRAGPVGSRHGNVLSQCMLGPDWSGTKNNGSAAAMAGKLTPGGTPEKGLTPDTVVKVILLLYQTLKWHARFRFDILSELMTIK